MRFNKIVAAGLCLISTTPAFADLKSISPGELKGDFYFYTYQLKSGQPLCSERWRFSDDGALTVYSGQEIVTKHFRLEDRETFFEHSTKTWNSTRLILGEAVSNGLPDCLDRTNAGEKASESVIYHGMDGSIAMCKSLTNYMNCYGHLYRAADVDAAEKKNASAR